MTEEVIPLRFDVEEVGKHVKSSKKRFTWELALKGRSHIVVLDFSFISGKVKVTVDRKILFQSQLPSNTSFQYPFTLDGNALNVIQQGQNFELRVNNKVFSHLYNQMKTNTQFKKYQDQVRDIKVDSSKFQGGNKKITLNIGTMGGMKKKNKAENAYQQHNWNAFSPDSMSFPSYFEGSETSSTITKTSEKTQKKGQSLLDDTKLSEQSSKTESILDFQAQVIKSEPKVQNQSQNLMQFSTMQNMFATMNMGTGNNIKKTEVVIDSNEVDFFNESPSTQTNVNVPTPPSELRQILGGVSDFNTMQNMFSTQQLGNNQGLQGFNTKQSVNQSSNVNANTPNLNDFNTMQQMFTTNNNAYNFNLNTNQNSQVEKPSSSNQFSTMQMLFTTTNNNPTSNVLNSNNQTVNAATTPANINLNDFSTMQQMFSTTNPSMTGSFNMNSGNISPQTGNFNTNFQVASNNAVKGTDFNTMQNLFTINAQQPSVNMNISSVTGNNQFNTMQNMFATTSPQNVSNLGQVNNAQNVYSTNTIQSSKPNTQVSQNEFNTMQNMFATNNALFSVNMTGSTTSNIQNNTKTTQKVSTNQPLSPNTMYMNTYSGISAQNQSGLDGGINMFTTGVGIPGAGSMKKVKQTSALDMFQVSKPSTNNSGDLL